MNTVEAPPTMPPVERLLAVDDTHLIARAALALVGGWHVRFTDEEDVPDFEAGELVGLPPDWLERDPFACILDEEDAPDRPDSSDWEWLPDPFTDPAAAWELGERELGQMDVRTRRVRWGWDVPYVPQSRPVTGVALRPEQWGPWHTDRKRAACFAVLHKHKDGPYKSLVIPLLERIKEEGLDK